MKTYQVNERRHSHYYCHFNLKLYNTTGGIILFEAKRNFDVKDT